MSKRNALGLLSICLLAVLPRALPAAIVPISILNYTYSPDTANIIQGDSVVWTNTTAFPHTTTSGAGGVPDSIWNSGTLGQGGMYGRTFSVVGSFPYYCTFHYPIHGMAGLIVVRSSAIREGSRSVPGFDPRLRVQPNPIRTSATITYRVAASPGIYSALPIRLSLNLYDIRGKLVTTLVKGYYNSGEYALVTAPNSLTRGIYVLRLELGADRPGVSQKLIVE